jgi:hypothetical protein
MPKGRIALIGALSVAAIVEVVGVFTSNDTISQLTSDLFHVSTTQGKWAFAVSWLGFAGWYLWHILHFPKSDKANTEEK